MRSRILGLTFAALVFAPAAPRLLAQDAADPLGFESQVRPILQKHCYDCHSGDKVKGGIDFSTLNDLESVLRFTTQWRQVRDVVDLGDMPPKPKDTGWTDEHRDVVLGWIRKTIENPDPDNPLFKNPGPPFLRQLNITEYTRTIRDLLGITVDISELTGIYPEPPVSGYSTFAQGLTMDPLQFENFFKAAQIVIGQLFSDPAQPWSQAADADVRKKEAEAARAALFAIGQGRNPRDAAQSILLSLVRRAYRRPVQVREIARFQQLFNDSLAGGASYSEALRKAMIPVLVSPSFIYRFEFNPAKIEKGATTHRINDHELAVRLSYFLWSSMPDDTLYKLASSGQLSKPDVYREQILRMLKDPKASALSEIFASEWIKLSRLKDALPSPDLYPEFTDEMKYSMRREVLAFFDDLRLNNRNVLNIINADYTFVDQNLAKLYNLSGEFGSELTRITLPPEANRGGILGMGAVLAKTSHVDRTKPTARGDWILGTLLGEPPPPPPPDAGRFVADPNRPPPRNFREQLERHSSDPACMVCHKKIDPLGYALENYDPIGRWRDQEKGKPVDNRGSLPTGELLEGVAGLKTVLMDRRNEFTKNLYGQLLSYAIGRDLQYYDRAIINQSAAEIRRQGYTFESLVLAVAESYPFQHRSIAYVRPPDSKVASNP